MPGAFPSDNAVAGRVWFYATFDAGPSFGLIRRPIFNERLITVASDSVQQYDFLILLNRAGVQTLQLPDVNLWMKLPYGQFPLLIKDKGINAGTFNKTILPFAGQFIDGLASLTLASDGAFAYIRPYSDLSGWMTAA